MRRIDNYGQLPVMTNWQMLINSITSFFAQPVESKATSSFSNITDVVCLTPTPQQLHSHYYKTSYLKIIVVTRN